MQFIVCRLEGENNSAEEVFDLVDVYVTRTMAYWRFAGDVHSSVKKLCAMDGYTADKANVLSELRSMFPLGVQK
jgi:hypothetical protein